MYEPSDWFVGENESRRHVTGFVGVSSDPGRGVLVGPGPYEFFTDDGAQVFLHDADLVDVLWQPDASLRFRFVYDPAQRLAPEGSRLTDLAEQAQVTKQTASLLVVALERQGFVERVPDPADGRARLIRLTRQGREASRRAQRVVRRVEEQWDDHLGPELAACLREALLRLREITDPCQ